MRPLIQGAKDRFAEIAQRRPRTFALCLALLAVLFALLVAKPTRGFALGLVGLAGYYALCGALLWATPAHEAWRSVKPRAKWAMLAVALAFVVFAGWYLSKYDFIPVWDNFTYWHKTLLFNQALMRVPLGTVLDALKSANFTDYGDIQCWIMSIPVQLLPLWKGTFLAEVILVSIPAAATLALAGVGFASSGAREGAMRERNGVAVVLAFLVCLLCPILLRPTLIGYLDEVAGLVFLCSIVAAHDESLIRSIWKPIVLGLALVAVMVMRRWLAYGVIALVVSALLRWGAHVALAGRGERAGELGHIARTFLLTAVAALLPLLTYYRPFLMRSLFGNYSEAYQGYATMGSLAERLSDVAMHYSWAWVVLAVLGFALLVRLFAKGGRENPATKPRAAECLAIVVCLCLGAFVAMLAFWRTQDFTDQHWLFFTFPFVLALSICVGGLVLYARQSAVRVLVPATCALSLVTCLNGLGLLGDSLAAVRPLVGSVSCSPMVQPDVEARSEFVNYLEGNVTAGEKVFFAASSARINASLPYSVLAPGKLYMSYECLSTDVDLRDGFNVGFLDAGWVVAATPVQTALKPEFTKVSVTLNELVQDQNSYLGRHYELAKTFECPDDMVIKVYRRKSELERGDVERLRDQFRELYPQHSELFEDRLNAYIDKMA